MLNRYHKIQISLQKKSIIRVRMTYYSLGIKKKVLEVFSEE